MVHPLGIYLHIPYCLAKCIYCDFNSYPLKNPRELSNFVTALLKEIELKRLAVPVDTIYFGGGTPSLLSPSQLEKILKKLYLNFKIKDEIEFSLEANPGTLNQEKFKRFKSLGINRLSLGAQSFNTKFLKKLNRAHQAKDIYKSYDLARSIGFKNINLDLLFGLPGQARDEFKQDLAKITCLKAEHLSLYNLTLKKENSLYKELPKESDQVWMYQYLINALKKTGYKHYEISNFSLPGFQCQHNLKYWRSSSYLGLGPGAHSLIKTSQSPWGKRIINTSHLQIYTQEKFTKEITMLSKNDSIREYVLTNFRLLKGINTNRFKSIYLESLENLFKEEINEFKTAGLLDFKENILRLSARGIFYADEITSNFMDLK